MMSLWDALRMNMMISYQELVRTFHSKHVGKVFFPPVFTRYGVQLPDMETAGKNIRITGSSFRKRIS